MVSDGKLARHAHRVVAFQKNEGNPSMDSRAPLFYLGIAWDHMVWFDFRNAGTPLLLVLQYAPVPGEFIYHRHSLLHFGEVSRRESTSFLQGGFFRPVGARLPVFRSGDLDLQEFLLDVGCLPRPSLHLSLVGLADGKHDIGHPVRNIEMPAECFHPCFLKPSSNQRLCVFKSCLFRRVALGCFNTDYQRPFLYCHIFPFPSYPST